MSTTSRDRIGAATGAVFVALIMVGNQMASDGSADSAHPMDEQLLSDVAHQASSATFTAGFVLEGLGFAAFIGFLGYLADALHRRVPRRGPGGIAAGVAARRQCPRGRPAVHRHHQRHDRRAPRLGQCLAAA